MPQTPISWKYLLESQGYSRTVKLIALCLCIGPLSLLAQNPCSTTVQTGIKTANSAIEAIVNTQKSFDDVTSALNGITDLVNSRTSDTAILSYIGYAAGGTVIVTFFGVSTGFLTLTLWRFVRNKLS